MPISSALLLAPGLELHARNEFLERKALEQLAAECSRFTPRVSLEPPQVLLLEIRGSLKLFGGLAPLVEEISQKARARHPDVILCCTPTPRASLWLARARPGHVTTSLTELRTLLGPVPLRHLGWPEKTVQSLSRAGVTRLEECFRLPRQGFARRFGSPALLDLDRALGRCPEPRSRYLPPEHFQETLELPEETNDASLLMEGCRRLISSLRNALRVHQSCIGVLWCLLHHPYASDTRLRIGLGRPSAEPAVLMDLLQLRLQTEVLSAPVCGITVQGHLLPGQRDVDRDLFGTASSTTGEVSALLDRLKARLGRTAVQGLSISADYRPERAWFSIEDPLHPPAARSLPAAGQRPAWLLAEPQRLEIKNRQPLYRGELYLDSGPERIESGWWDGDDIRRDYYVASDSRGSRLWIYRDLRNAGWYLHGIFG